MEQENKVPVEQEKNTKSAGQFKQLLRAFLNKLRGAKTKNEVETIWQQMMQEKMFTIDPCLEAMHRVEKQGGGDRSRQMERQNQNIFQQQAQTGFAPPPVSQNKPTLADLLAGLKQQQIQ